MRTVALAQGGYFLVSGVWPLVHMPSFLAVTGKKTDLWLVRTVGALVAVAGSAIAAAAWRDRVTAEIVTLATGSAVALAAVDVIYTSRGTIPPVYLLDAVAEGTLLTAWAAASVATTPGRSQPQAASGGSRQPRRLPAT